MKTSLLFHTITPNTPEKVADAFSIISCVIFALCLNLPQVYFQNLLPKVQTSGEPSCQITHLTALGGGKTRQVCQKAQSFNPEGEDMKCICGTPS